MNEPFLPVIAASEMKQRLLWVVGEDVQFSAAKGPRQQITLPGPYGRFRSRDSGDAAPITPVDHFSCADPTAKSAEKNFERDLSFRRERNARTRRSGQRLLMRMICFDHTKTRKYKDRHQ